MDEDRCEETMIMKANVMRIRMIYILFDSQIFTFREKLTARCGCTSKE